MFPDTKCYTNIIVCTSEERLRHSLGCYCNIPPQECNIPIIDSRKGNIGDWKQKSCDSYNIHILYWEHFLSHFMNAWASLRLMLVARSDQVILEMKRHYKGMSYHAGSLASLKNRIFHSLDAYFYLCDTHPPTHTHTHMCTHTHTKTHNA